MTGIRLHWGELGHPKLTGAGWRGPLVCRPEKAQLQESGQAVSCVWVTGEEGGTGVCSEGCHLEGLGSGGLLRVASGPGGMRWGGGL